MPTRDLIGLEYLLRLYKVDEKCIEKVKKSMGREIVLDC